MRQCPKISTVAEMVVLSGPLCKHAFKALCNACSCFPRRNLDIMEVVRRQSRMLLETCRHIVQFTLHRDMSTGKLMLATVPIILTLSIAQIKAFILVESWLMRLLARSGNTREKTSGMSVVNSRSKSQSRGDRVPSGVNGYGRTGRVP
jgi:hypothetical protein